MAQKAENFAFEGKYSEYIPKDSTAIAAGDAVMLRRDTGQIEVMLATPDGFRNFVGICDDKWSDTIATQKYGAGQTDYSSPTTRPVKLKVYHEGVFNLDIEDTTGYAGQAVYLVTSTTGGQIFTIDPDAGEVLAGPVGYLYENFSGGSANDTQKVRITAGIQTSPPDFRWFLMNHLVCIDPNMATISPVYSAPSDTFAITIPRFFAFAQGIWREMPSGTSCGTVSGGPGTDAGCGIAGHQVVIWAIDSAGSVVAFVDRAKATDAGSATMLAVSGMVYWPSVSLDYMPFGIAQIAHSRTYFTGRAVWFQRSIADCLKVT